VSIGTLEIDGPSRPTSAVSASSAAPTPTSAERQPRVTPTARTMGQGLDHLDGARQEGAEEEEDVGGHDCVIRRLSE
jgi:hypothetical protein